MRKIILFVVLVVSGVGALVQADDVFDPPWQGVPNNWVHAEFDSWQPSSPSPADVASSGWGTGLSTWTPKAGYCAVRIPGFQNRTGILQHDLLTDDRKITPIMPNFNNQNPTKEIFVQVTYWSPTGPIGNLFESWWFWTGYESTQPLYPMPAMPDFIRNPQIGAVHNHGNDWYTAAFSVAISPNPAWEAFTMWFNPDIMQQTGNRYFYVDQVVVDTYCVPEPATLALLAVGGLLMRKR